MRRVSILLIPFFLAAAPGVEALAFGTYQIGTKHFTEIEVRPDGTFSYRHYGDLESGSATGTWSLIAENLIVARTPPPPKLDVPKPITTGRDDLTIEVLFNATPVAGAEVRVRCHNRTRVEKCDLDGRARFPSCDRNSLGLRVQFEGLRPALFEMPTEVDDSAVEGYAVELMPEPIEILDELWYFADDRLLVLEVMPFERVSP